MTNDIIKRVLERLGQARPRVSKGYGAGRVIRSRAIGRDLGSTIQSISNVDYDASVKTNKRQPVKISKAFSKSAMKDDDGNHT